jgi:glycopeptide antibiotics resistance protein
MLQRYSKSKLYLFFLLVILLALAIYGGPPYHSPRSVQAAWNIGHIILFGLLVYFLNKYWLFFQKKPLLHQIIIMILITGIIGILIEIFQYIAARGTPDINDLKRNYIGALFAFIFLSDIKHKFNRYLSRITIILCLVLQFLPVMQAMADEIKSIRSFPILADFEYKSEIDRWSGEAEYHIDQACARHGQRGLHIKFLTTQYSGISLNHFPGNWQGYQYLVFDFFNPDSVDLIFTCRIHDAQHTKGSQAYDDRFNRRFIARKGWNEFQIYLDDVKKAPNRRELDLSDVVAIGIFTSSLRQPRVAYLDNIRLE